MGCPFYFLWHCLVLGDRNVPKANTTKIGEDGNDGGSRAEKIMATMIWGWDYFIRRLNLIIKLFCFGMWLMSSYMQWITSFHPHNLVVFYIFNQVVLLSSQVVIIVETCCDCYVKKSSSLKETQPSSVRWCVNPNATCNFYDMCSILFSK